MNKIKLEKFGIGDEIEFIKDYNPQHPIEYYGYVPPISKGTRGTINKISENAIHVKVENIDNLITLWNEKSSHGNIQDRVDCIKVIKKGNKK